MSETTLKQFQNQQSVLLSVITKLFLKKYPIIGLRGPEGSRKLRFPDYMTVAQDGGKVVSLTYRLHFTPRKYFWYTFLLEAESTPGP